MTVSSSFRSGARRGAGGHSGALGSLLVALSSPGSGPERWACGGPEMRGPVQAPRVLGSLVWFGIVILSMPTIIVDRRLADRGRNDAPSRPMACRWWYGELLEIDGFREAFWALVLRVGHLHADQPARGHPGGPWQRALPSAVLHGIQVYLLLPFTIPLVGSGISHDDPFRGNAGSGQRVAHRAGAVHHQPALHDLVGQRLGQRARPRDRELPPPIAGRRPCRPS